MHGLFPPLPSISAQRKAPRRRLTKERRQALIEKAETILRTGEPTIFAFEGACRAGLRSGFCIEGFGWALADIEAASIVEAALRHLGASRPTWKEGQSEQFNSLVHRVYCANPRCQKPIERPEGDYFFRLYCSSECKVSVGNVRYAAAHHADLIAYWTTYRAGRRAAGKPSTCEQCGRPFRAVVHRKKLQRFCCQRCAVRWNNRARKSVC